MKRVLLIIAFVALSGYSALVALEPCDGVWVEPFSSAYAIAGGMPRLVAGAGFPATERFALDTRALAEWNPDHDNGFFQIKADALARWYATRATTRGGTRAGLYFALGAGIGYARLDGDDTVRILAVSPVAEAGARIAIGSLPLFVEPFAGYSLSAGPRLADGIARFGVASGVTAGLRIGWSFREF